MKYFSFKLKYFALFILIFIVEILIAKFLTDQFIRPFVGDVLVVVLIYFFFKSFLNISYKKIAIGVLIFACCIEVLQLFHLVQLLHLEHNKIMRIAIGSVFDFKDIIAYCIGYFICLKIK
jgi:hypothetical protein